MNHLLIILLRHVQDTDSGITGFKLGYLDRFSAGEVYINAYHIGICTRRIGAILFFIFSCDFSERETKLKVIYNSAIFFIWWHQLYRMITLALQDALLWFSIVCLYIYSPYKTLLYWWYCWCWWWWWFCFCRLVVIFYDRFVVLFSADLLFLDSLWASVIQNWSVGLLEPSVLFGL